MANFVNQEIFLLLRMVIHACTWTVAGATALVGIKMNVH